MRHVRTRPTFSLTTSPLSCSTCRCCTTAGSEIVRGAASSLTDAGPRLRWSYSAAMRALVQRVARASVSVDGETVSSIGPGLLVLLGVCREDGEAQAQRLAERVRALRVFPDEAGNMNEALGEREILCVSQFTLYGDTRRGNRPSFVAAAQGEQAQPLYELFCERAGAARGVFGAHMLVELVNDGPVTVMLEA